MLDLEPPLRKHLVDPADELVLERAQRKLFARRQKRRPANVLRTLVAAAVVVALGLILLFALRGAGSETIAAKDTRIFKNTSSGHELHRLGTEFDLTLSPNTELRLRRDDDGFRAELDLGEVKFDLRSPAIRWIVDARDVEIDVFGSREVYAAAARTFTVARTIEKTTVRVERGAVKVYSGTKAFVPREVREGEGPVSVSRSAPAPDARAEDEALIGGEPSGARTFICGYALPGYGCDNGRKSAWAIASDIKEAIAACAATKPAGYTDFCYLIAVDGGTFSDPGECSSLAGAWRPGNSCCNFNGTRSCPAVRKYVCGYAAPEDDCENVTRSQPVNTSDLSSALAACRAAELAGSGDFCQVIDSTGGTAADAVHCAAASGAWRPRSSCCHFRGSRSCP